MPAEHDARLGGTLLAATLSYLTAKNDDRIRRVDLALADCSFHDIQSGERTFEQIIFETLVS